MKSLVGIDDVLPNMSLEEREKIVSNPVLKGEVEVFMKLLLFMETYPEFAKLRSNSIRLFESYISKSYPEVRDKSDLI